MSYNRNYEHKTIYNILQNYYPTTDMLLCDNGHSVCLKREYVSKFHDAIMNVYLCGETG